MEGDGVERGECPNQYSRSLIFLSHRINCHLHRCDVGCVLYLEQRLPLQTTNGFALSHLEMTALSLSPPPQFIHSLLSPILLKYAFL